MNSSFDPTINMLAQPSGVVIPHPASQIHQLSETLTQEDNEKPLSHLMNLIQSSDSQTILQATGPKLFDHFTIWDLMLAKSKLSSENGTLSTLVQDVALILCELKILVESCLRPILVGKVAIKKKSEECIEFDDMMTMAMGLDTNIWLKKNTDRINYHNPLLNIDELFPPKKENDILGKMNMKGENNELIYEDSKVILENVKLPDDNHQVTPETLEQVELKRRRKRKIKDETNEETKKGEFECVKCGKNYLNFTAWYKHMEKTCASRTSLRISIRTIGDKYYCAFKNCLTPKKPFDSKDDVHDHWALNHVDERHKIVPCFLCDQKFATIGAKKVHMSKVHVKENPLVKKRKKQVEIEVDDEHKGAKEKHLCLKCGQSMNKESGKKHEEKCNGMYVRRPEYKKVDDEYFCTVVGCNLGYGFNSMYGLRKHFHGKHTREEEKFFACDYCDEKFSFKTTRNKHITEKHMKNHVCDICGKGFGGRSKMMQHRFLHTGEKPYACSKCDYRAAKKCNLEAHLESKHSVFQQKNFICAICNKQFVTMGRVRRHMAEIHADGVEEDGVSASEKRRRKRHRIAPPPDIEADRGKRIVMPPQVQDIQSQNSQVLHQVNEQDAAVQYLQTELGQGNETVITLRPLY